MKEIIIEKHLRQEEYQRPTYPVPGIGYVHIIDVERYNKLFELPPRSININTVLVPSGDSMCQPPLRFALYMAEVMNTASNLKERGHLINHFRVATPVYIVSAVNQVQVDLQLKNAVQTIETIAKFKYDLWPDLDEVPFSLDVGKYFDLNEDLLNQIAYIESSLTNLSYFQDRAQNHNGGYPTDPSKVSLYIYAHAPFWGYQQDNNLTRLSENNRVVTLNLAPQSELPYLNAMYDLGYLRGEDHQPITAIVSATTYAPYYYLKNIQEPEMSLENINTQTIRQTMQTLSQGRFSGNYQAGRVKKQYGILGAIIQEQLKKYKHLDRNGSVGLSIF